MYAILNKPQIYRHWGIDKGNVAGVLHMPHKKDALSTGCYDSIPGSINFTLTPN